MKKLIEILSIVLFVVNEFDSCAVGLGNALGGNRKYDGSAVMVLGLFMFIAGIISLCSKRYSERIIAAIIFYCIAALIGYCNINSFKEIRIWAIINTLFASLLLIDLIVRWKVYLYYEDKVEANKKSEDTNNFEDCGDEENIQ